MILALIIAIFIQGLIGGVFCQLSRDEIEARFKKAEEEFNKPGHVWAHNYQDDSVVKVMFILKKEHRKDGEMVDEMLEQLRGIVNKVPECGKLGPGTQDWVESTALGLLYGIFDGCYRDWREAFDAEESPLSKIVSFGCCRPPIGLWVMKTAH